MLTSSDGAWGTALAQCTLAKHARYTEPLHKRECSQNLCLPHKQKPVPMQLQIPLDSSHMTFNLVMAGSRQALQQTCIGINSDALSKR